MKTLNLSSYLSARKSPEEIRFLSNSFSQITKEELHFLHEIANFYEKRRIFQNHQKDAENRMDSLFEKSCLFLKSPGFMNLFFQDLAQRKKKAREILSLQCFDVEGFQKRIQMLEDENKSLMEKLASIKAEIPLTKKQISSLEAELEKVLLENELLRAKYQQRFKLYKDELSKIIEETNNIQTTSKNEETNEQQLNLNHQEMIKKFRHTVDVHKLQEKRFDIKKQLEQVEKDYDEFQEFRKQTKDQLQLSSDEASLLKQKIIRVKSLTETYQDLKKKAEQFQQQLAFLNDQYANLKRRDERQSSERQHFIEVDNNIARRKRECQRQENEIDINFNRLKSRREMLKNDEENIKGMRKELNELKKQSDQKEIDIKNIANEVKSTLQKCGEITNIIYEKAHENEENFNSFEEIEKYLREQGVMSTITSNK